MRVQAEVISSTAITQQVVQKIPEQQCSVVDVPIYSQNNASTGDVLAGAIIMVLSVINSVKVKVTM